MSHGIMASYIIAMDLKRREPYTITKLLVSENVYYIFSRIVYLDSGQKKF